MIEKENQNFRSNNDLFLGLPLLFNAKKTLISNEILYNYRILSNSISHKRDPYNRINVSLNTMNYFYTIFSEKNFLSENTIYLIHSEIIREILPEIYIVFRHFFFNRKKTKEIKKDRMFQQLLKDKRLKSILKKHNIKQRLAFYIFKSVI